MTEDKTKQMKNIAKLLALHEISEMAGGADELGRILQHLCACILDAANVPRGALVVRDENNNSFRVAVCQGLPDAFRDEYIELTRDLLFERRLFSRDELIIDEVEDLAEQSYKEMYLKCGITRRIVLPLTVRERTIGLLEFYPDPKCRVSKEQTDQCLLLAHLVAVAVDNSAIFSHAERLATTDGVRVQRHSESRRARCGPGGALHRRRVRHRPARNPGRRRHDTRQPALRCGPHKQFSGTRHEKTPPHRQHRGGGIP